MLAVTHLVPDPSGGLLGYGVLGIFTVLWLTGRVVAKPTLDSVTEERDRIAKERDDERVYSRSLESKLRDDLIPAMTEWTKTGERTIEFLIRAEAATDHRRER